MQQKIYHLQERVARLKRNLNKVKTENSALKSQVAELTAFINRNREGIQELANNGHVEHQYLCHRCKSEMRLIDFGSGVPLAVRCPLCKIIYTL